MQAVEGCEKLAYEYGNQEIEQEHLLYALLTQDDSLLFFVFLERIRITLRISESRPITGSSFCSRARWWQEPNTAENSKNV